ncbi:MAG: superoxide dismutase family protein [Parvularculaceae bacterium]
MMRASLLLAGLSCLAGLTACGPAPDASGAAPPEAVQAATAPTAKPIYGARTRARLLGGNGERIGDVFAWQGAGGLVIQLRSDSLPPGWHGVHLHMTGDCSDTGVFKASGGHVEGEGGPHGFLHPDGSHGGDLPNIHAHADGTARADYFTASVALDDIMDSDGAALIIHAAPDDYQTQPIGNAGARIACAAFGE